MRCLLLLLALVCCCGCSGGNSKWEYKHHRDISEYAMTERLNQYGDVGWELVSLAIDDSESGAQYHTVYKRRK
jgi:hypothetical protein